MLFCTKTTFTKVFPLMLAGIFCLPGSIPPVFSAVNEGAFITFGLPSGAEEVSVLTFHSIAPADYVKSTFTLTPEMLENLLVEMEEYGFHFLSSKEYVDFILHHEPIPEKSVFLTFDDGVSDTYHYAFPILKRHGAPACVFLITSKLNSAAYLSSQKVKEMYDSGLIDFQSHSYNLHYLKDKNPIIFKLKTESEEEYRVRIVNDLEKSSRDIRELINISPVMFSVPFGAGDKAVEEIAQAAGFSMVLYVGTDINQSIGGNPLHLDRITVKRSNFKVLPNLLARNHFSINSRFPGASGTQTEEKNSPDLAVRSSLTADDSIIFSSPAFTDNGTFYIGAWDNCLHAVDSMGKYLWKYKTLDGISSSPAVGSDGTVYVGSYDRCLHAVNPNGTMKWTFKTWDAVFSSPALDSRGAIYFGSTDGRFFSLNPNGSLRWEVTTGDAIFSSPAVAKDGTVYICSYDHILYAFQNDGKVKWGFRAGGCIDSSPALGKDGTVYFGCWDNSLYAVNPNGTFKWQFKVGDRVDSSPAVGADGTVYFGCWDGCLYALNPQGTLKWKLKTGGRIHSSPAIGSDGVIYVGSMDGCFYAVEKQGTLKWKFRTGGGIDSSPAITPEGVLSFGSQDNSVYSIDRGGKAGLMSSPWPKFRQDRQNSGKPATEATLRLIYPVGGEKLGGKTFVPITWTSSIINTVKIEYSLNGGTSWNTIEGKAPSLGFYAWDVSGILGNDYRIRISDSDNPLQADQSKNGFSLLPSAVEEIPHAFRVYAPFPNPFNPITRIRYEIPGLRSVRFVIYDCSGREVITLRNGPVSMGIHEEIWNGRDRNGAPVASGMYLYRITAGEHAAAGKVMLIR